MKKFSFNAEVWRWPGDAGWHFVNVPKSISSKIRENAKKYGAGFVKVEVTIGKTSWVTALFPHKESETYLLSIKKSVRKKEGIYEDSKIKVSFVIPNSKIKPKTFADTVYAVVKKIQRGKTMTYKEVAEKAGRPLAFRAVGNILNKNFDKSIPCHRVIRSDGATGGYNRGADRKKKILKSEILNT